MIPRSVERVLLGFFLSFVGVFLAGATYQAFAARRDRRQHSPPGQLVDVEGHALHLHLAGMAHEGPTVILESGLAFPSVQWCWVHPEVARFASVVAYDRAGTGWSEPGPKPRDARRIVAELRAALQAAKVSGPYVVVGHSFGGLLARAFADLYPEDVVGVVLVDATHPDELERSRRQREAMPTLERTMKTAPLLARLGILRLVLPRAGWVRSLPPARAAEMVALLATPDAWTEATAEIAAWREYSNRQVRRAPSLGTVPLAVLTGSDTVALDPVHGELQTELANLSPNSVHRVVDGADHESIVLDRENAMIITDAIRRVLEATCNEYPLSTGWP